MRSKNPRDVAYIFREYAQKIHARCTPDDPSFIKIAAVCGRVSSFARFSKAFWSDAYDPKIEKWCEDQYPSFVRMVGTSQQFDSSDPRSLVAQTDDERQRKLALSRRQAELLKGNADVVKAVQDMKAAEEGSEADIWKYVGAAFLIVFAVGVTSVYGIMWVLDNVKL